MHFIILLLQLGSSQFQTISDTSKCSILPAFLQSVCEEIVESGTSFHFSINAGNEFEVDQGESANYDAPVQPRTQAQTSTVQQAPAARAVRSTPHVERHWPCRHKH